MKSPARVFKPIPISVAFLGWVINMTDNPLNTCVCREKTNKNQSHVDNRYKRSLITTMLDRANRL